MNESIQVRNEFIRRMYKTGKSVNEIVLMLRDVSEADVVEIIGVKKVYGSK